MHEIFKASIRKKTHERWPECVVCVIHKGNEEIGRQFGVTNVRV